MVRRRRGQSEGAGSGRSRRPAKSPVGLRVIGGTFRGRRLLYSGDPDVRPMKDRVREAVFNILATAVRGKHAIDLFAGTGALGLEALSRGASHATFLEQHFPTAEVLRRNVATLGVERQVDVFAGDVFLRARWQHLLGNVPWLVFCSPPYAFYLDRNEEMLDLLDALMQAAPPGSIFVVESDQRFNHGQLRQADHWDVRCYPPAVIATCVKSS